MSPVGGQRRAATVPASRHPAVAPDDVGSARRRVLYVIVCGSPPAARVGRLVRLAQAERWDVCDIATPEGRKFIDEPALVRQTGHPVRSSYKQPGEPDVLPAPDAFLVVPATVNTINKWAVGITDTLALGLLIEGQTKGLPSVAVPYTNATMATHPAFRESLDRLRGWDVTVLFGEDVLPLHPPGTGERHVDDFPWELPLAALRARFAVHGLTG